jgi:hypothetical protein
MFVRVFWCNNVTGEQIYVSLTKILQDLQVFLISAVYLAVFFIRLSPFVLHDLPISSSLTWSFWLYLTMNTGYAASHYAVSLRTVIHNEIPESPFTLRNRTWESQSFHY